MSTPNVSSPGVDEILSHFQRDKAYIRQSLPAEDLLGGRIAGARAVKLLSASDRRGDLIELMTLRDEDIEPIVHAYQVFCEPGSIRAWIYHTNQTDRLCYTEGSFRIALYDLRADSPTAGNLVTFTAGADTPTKLFIPPFVAHGVQNVGSERASFVNFPTRIYNHERPDKLRLPYNSPLIPFNW